MTQFSFPYKVHLDAREVFQRWPPNMTCLKETLLWPIVSDALYVVDQSQQPGPSDQSERSRLTVRRGLERLNRLRLYILRKQNQKSVYFFTLHPCKPIVRDSQDNNRTLKKGIIGAL